MKYTLAFCFAMACGIFPINVRAADTFVTSQNGLEIWTVDGSIPPKPDDSTQTRILQFRTEDPNAVIVTFDQIVIAGGLRQVWPSGFFGAAPTPFHYSWRENDQEMRNMDSHLLVPEFAPILGGSPLFGETNNGDVEGDFQIGFGEIRHDPLNDAFFLSTSNQANRVNFAQLIVNCDAAAAGEVYFSGTILGDGFQAAAFERVPIDCVPEPRCNGVWFLALGFFLRRSFAQANRYAK